MAADNFLYTLESNPLILKELDFTIIGLRLRIKPLPSLYKIIPQRIKDIRVIENLQFLWEQICDEATDFVEKNRVLQLFRKTWTKLDVFNESKATLKL